MARRDVLPLPLLAIEAPLPSTWRSASLPTQNTLVINAFLRWATDEQRSTFLCPCSQPNSIGAYAFPEAGSGSDVFALTTRGPQWKGLAHHGCKLWITNANEAAGLFIVVFANANPERRAIEASRHSSSSAECRVSRWAKRKTNGIRASSTCRLVLDECRVPASHVLGEVGKATGRDRNTEIEGRLALRSRWWELAQGAL